MKTKTLVIALSILYSLTTFSQVTFHGKVIGQKTKESLPYVNIGIVGKNIGTVSNINGEFTINLPNSYNSDTLRFSMIGYKSQSYEVREFKNKFINHQELIIHLEQSMVALKEVVIIDKKKWKTKILGNVNETVTVTSGFYSEELGTEVGTIIKIRKSPTYVENFSFYIAENTFDSLFFRLNIYNLKKGKPFENILDKNIFIQTNVKKGKVTIDLEKYNIVMQENFFISLEYVKPLSRSGGNVMSFGSGFFNSPSYSRHTSQGDWNKDGWFCLGFNVKVKY
jgi:hypothetical protein